MATARARRNGSSATLAALEALRPEFGREFAARKRAALAAAVAARHARPRDLVRLHDALCFLRAYPDDRALLAAVERALAAFDRRPDLRRHAHALENSGVAGTAIAFRFFEPMAGWLAARWPDRLTLDWNDWDHAARLETFLPLIAAGAEVPGLDEYDLGPRGWVDKMRGAATDATFFVTGIRRALPDSAARERLYDELDPPMTLAPGPDTPARGRERLRFAPRAFQRAPLSRARPDLAREAGTPPLAITPLAGRRARDVVDLARACMVTRSRDLDAFSYGDPRDVRLADCGDGLAFAILGVRPERRLLLESVYAFLTLKNGVPIGYVLCSGLYGSAEIAYNVFETWRGAEAGRIYGRVIGTVRALLGADCFTIYPYQLGDGNDEAIESGAWWFYQKLGFRPADRGALALMNAELARMEKNPRHRSSAATLRRLAAHNVYWHAGAPRADVIGRVPLAAVGLAVMDTIAKRFGADRDAAEAACDREARALLGAPRGWSREELAAWRRWAPLALALPGVETWSDAERAALAEVIRAKGGQRESDFVARFDAHPRLRAAVTELGRRGD